MNSEIILDLYVSLLMTQIPVLVISIVGLRMSILKRSMIAKASKYAIWGFSLIIAYSFINIAVQLIFLYIRTEYTSRKILDGAFLWPTILSSASYLIFIAGLIMLTRAIFADRNFK